MQSSITIRVLALVVAVVACSITTVQALDESWFRQTSLKLHQAQTQDECVPCTSSSNSASLDIAGGSRHRRQLQFLSKLRENVKDIVTPRRGDDSSTTEAAPEMIDMVISSDFFMGNNNTRIGQIFLDINANPMLQQTYIGLILLIILPLIAVEVESIVTQTPIICILGLSDTTPFMGPCSDFERNRLRRRHLRSSYGRQLQGDDSFLKSYFNGTVESLRIPDMDATDSNVTTELMKIVDYGLSDGVFDMMNNVTVMTVIDEIASSNSTRPFLTMTVLALLPVLMIDNMDTTPAATAPTGAPVSSNTASASTTNTTCKGKNCNTRPPRSLSVNDQCEMEYIQCQIQSILALFDQ